MARRRGTAFWTKLLSAPFCPLKAGCQMKPPSCLQPRPWAGLHLLQGRDRDPDFVGEGPRVSGFLGHKVSVTPDQLCLCSLDAAPDDMQMNGQ